MKPSSSTKRRSKAAPQVPTAKPGFSGANQLLFKQMAPSSSIQSSLPSISTMQARDKKGKNAKKKMVYSKKADYNDFLGGAEEDDSSDNDAPVL